MDRDAVTTCPVYSHDRLHQKGERQLQDDHYGPKATCEPGKGDQDDGATDRMTKLRHDSEW